jgi:predicted HTH transcriptional regulator
VTLVRPEDFKVSADPDPFSYRLVADDRKNPTTAKLIGESTSAADAGDLGKEQAILEYLAEHERASTNSIRKACRTGREEITGVLERMVRNGTLDRTEGGVGKANYWFIREVKS